MLGFMQWYNMCMLSPLNLVHGGTRINNLQERLTHVLGLVFVSEDRMDAHIALCK